MNFVDGLVAKCHVGYVVEDVEAALDNLQDKLQCALDAKTYLFKPEKVWICGVAGQNIALKIALCKIKDNMTFEYIQPVTPEGFHFLSLISSGDSINHVCFATEDYDGYHKEFEAMGAQFLFEAVANDKLNGYRRCFYAKIPGIPGVMEILENAKPYRE